MAGIFHNPQNPTWLPQLSLSTTTELHDTAAHTTVIQTFINPSTSSPITDAQYTFPLYESSAIVSFRCTIGTTLIHGIVKEKDQAAADFRAAVGRNEPAGLLQQHTPDVFTTSLGAIAPVQTVTVEIEYIMELKHDAELDALRLTIPSTIAPRYGTPPAAVAAYPGAVVTGINMSVKFTMPSNILSIQSPSHAIAIYLGSHTTQVPEADFNPNLALATLQQDSTALDRDVVILAKCADLASPTALLESHPTILNSHALMLTLVPRFRLPTDAPNPEIVFIVDRSGSMSGKIPPLKSSLAVFLRSLPLGINFNICSFGSRFDFLWPYSRPYSNQTLAEAQRHVNTFAADFGGTEILPPIQAAIGRRQRSRMLEIMVLTDGQVWNSNALFSYVEKETQSGNVRLFTLGIGPQVSHALVDGLARVGRGFSQVIVSELEGMESKVARMLRGALSPHVNDYRLEWEGKPSAVPTIPTSAPINLFDLTLDPDMPAEPSDLELEMPAVLQAPHILPPLFPFSRYTAYTILSPNAPPPSEVFLRGTTPSGTPLELRIPVQVLPQAGRTIHQLGARKILQELEDGIGYVHAASKMTGTPTATATLDSWVRKEGVRIGSKYEIASKWTSFVAVVAQVDAVDDAFEMVEGASAVDDNGDENNDEDEWTHVPAQDNPPAVPVMMAFLPAPPPLDYPSKPSSKFSGTKPSFSSAKSIYPSSKDGYDLKKSSYSPTSPSFSPTSPSYSPTSPSSPSWADYDSSAKMFEPASFKSGKVSPSATVAGFDGSFKSSEPQGVDSYAPPSGYEFEPASFKSGPKKLDMSSRYGDESPSSFRYARRQQKVELSGPPPEYHSGLTPPGKVTSSVWSHAKQRTQRYSAASAATTGSSVTLIPPPGESDLSAPSMAGSGPASFESNPLDSSAATGFSSFFTRSRAHGKVDPSSPSTGSSGPSWFPPSPPKAKLGGFGSSFKYSPPKGVVDSSAPSIYDFAPASPVSASPQPSVGDSAASSEMGGKFKSRLSSLSYLPASSSSNLFQQPQSSNSTPTISYSPAKTLPAWRLASETTKQPLSAKTKALIGLQTFEGSFALGPELASELGIVLQRLESHLLASHAGADMETRRRVWATMLAITYFERKLAMERSGWELVMGKARTWIRSVTVISQEEVSALEALAEFVLGV